MNSAPRWYVAAVVLRAEVAGSGDTDLPVEHQVRLVQAAGASEARTRAEALGRAEERAYRNAAGEQVHWRYPGLRDPVRLHAPRADGAELCSWHSGALDALEVVAPDQLTVF